MNSSIGITHECINPPTIAGCALGLGAVCTLLTTVEDIIFNGERLETIAGPAWALNAKLVSAERVQAQHVAAQKGREPGRGGPGRALCDHATRAIEA